ncbi:MAG: hypothetical protein IPL52_01525 [Flavobacteriales bacterium]|nr:hypothetical protein [Flavobacteriales bacterium]
MEQRSRSFLAVIGFGLSAIVTGQISATIIQERCFGDSLDDDLRRFNSFGVTISAIGSSTSSNGDLPGNFGGHDLWYLEMDQEFSPITSENFGSSAFDEGSAFVDHGDTVVIVGNTQGTAWGCSGASSNVGLIKRSGPFTVAVQYCMEGSQVDQARKVLFDEETGEYVILLDVRSEDEVFSPYLHHGQVDLGLFVMDQEFNVLQGRLWGSSGYDLGKDMLINAGVVYVAAESDGVDGDLEGTASLGSDDMVLASFPLSDINTTLSVQRYGGNGADHVERMFQRPGGGIGLVGSTLSDDFCDSTFPEANAIILALNGSGAPDWCRSLQGSGSEIIVAAVYSPLFGRVFVVGHTSSADGELPFAGSDLEAFIAAVEEVDGEVEWITSYGGSGDELARDIMMAVSGNILTLNMTSSVDGDVESTQHGLFDAWVVEFGHTTALAEARGRTDRLRIAPVPADDRINVVLPAGTLELVVKDLQGRVLLTRSVVGSGSSMELDLGAFASGQYLIIARAVGGEQAGRCMKR